MVFYYTGKEYNIFPYYEQYESYNKLPIDTVATACQSPENGEVYIMVFNEALYMGKLKKNSLIKTNQLQNYHVNVQDDSTSRRPLSIIPDDGDFAMNLHREGNIVYCNSNTPTPK